MREQANDASTHNPSPQMIFRILVGAVRVSLIRIHPPASHRARLKNQDGTEPPQRPQGDGVSRPRLEKYWHRARLDACRTTKPVLQRVYFGYILVRLERPRPDRFICHDL